MREGLLGGGEHWRARQRQRVDSFLPRYYGAIRSGYGPDGPRVCFLGQVTYGRWKLMYLVSGHCFPALETTFCFIGLDLPGPGLPIQ